MMVAAGWIQKSANLQRNSSKPIGRNFIMQQDNDPKHTASMTKVFIKEKKWKVLDRPSQSLDFNPIEHAFHLLKEKHHKRRMQQFGHVNGLQAWGSYCKQRICYQILSVNHFNLLKSSLFQYFCSPKKWVVWYQRYYVLRHLGINTRK